jgi:hypothetical protein
MKTKILSISIILVLGVLLFSCGTKAEPITSMDFSAVQTQAVETFAYSLTQTAEAVPTFTSTPTLEPTITLTPTSTGEVPATPTKNDCYKMLWIEDLTIIDGTVMKSNEVFTKTWLVQNNGGCAWAPGFTFSNIGGDPMGAKTFVFKKPIPVGLKYELSIDMVVPSGMYGLIQSTWKMAYEPGMYFGDPLTVSIVVENPNGSTPTVTPTP